jgi:hypothetical protein
MCAALSLQEIDTEDQAALADAGIEPARARRYLAKAAGKGHLGAVWHPPGDELVVDEQFPDASQLADANDPKHRDLHRIVAPAEPDDAVTFAALVRHELEHARQHDALGQPIFDLQRFIENCVLPYRAALLEGCGGPLVNGVPTEIDCNAAASVYVSARFTAEEVATLRSGRRKPLACSLVGPEPFETLPTRMVAYVHIHRSCAEAYVKEYEPQRSVSELLEERYPDAAEVWAYLERGLAGPAPARGG